RHRLHLADDLGEPLAGLPEQGVNVAGGVLVDAGKRFFSPLALVLGGGAHQVELAGECSGPLGARLGNDARDIASPGLGGVERLLEQSGKTGEPLVEIAGPRVEVSDQGSERLTAL